QATSFTVQRCSNFARSFANRTVTRITNNVFSTGDNNIHESNNNSYPTSNKLKFPMIQTSEFDIRRNYVTSVKRNPQEDMSIEITERAAKQLKNIAKTENNRNAALRISVDSGGCHGFQYFYDLTDESSFKEDDVVFENNGATVVVDPVSLRMVKGSKIDYTEELIGSQFQVVNNPQASSGCGCGVSFELNG
ncbi:14654_t:CDS:2, partial [Acaulospora morrowiae]